MMPKARTTKAINRIMRFSHVCFFEPYVVAAFARQALTHIKMPVNRCQQRCPKSRRLWFQQKIAERDWTEVQHDFASCRSSLIGNYRFSCAEGSNMTRHFPAAVVIFGMLGFALEPAHAQFYGPGAWCAVTNTGWGNMHWDCRYRSIAECRPNVLAGNRGFCNRNPSFAPKQRKRS